MVRVPEIKKILRHTPPEHTVIFLGPPGIGKTVAVYEYAREEAEALGRTFVDYDGTIYDLAKVVPELRSAIFIDETKQVLVRNEEQFRALVNLEVHLAKELITHADKYYLFKHLRHYETEPTDLTGLPREVSFDSFIGDVVAYKPFLFVKTYSIVPGTIFWDEVTVRAREDQTANLMKAINERKLGATPLHPLVRQVCAGNRAEESMIAERLAEPIKKGRAKIIETSPPTVREWGEWMDINVPVWDKRTLAYLMKVPDDFFSPSRDVDEGEACPRAWHKLAVELVNTPEDIVEPTVVGWLGSDVGGRFLAFLKGEHREPLYLSILSMRFMKGFSVLSQEKPCAGG